MKLTEIGMIFDYRFQEAGKSHFILVELAGDWRWGG
jgi:hypothetical protein